MGSEMDEKFHKEAHQIVNHNIHNTIESAALWFTDMVKKKVADKDEDGMTFTCMAAGTMLAFSFEAYLNAVGSRKLVLWNEWDEYYKKIDKIFQNLKITPDWGKRPYSSISAMRRLRNALAHGKPQMSETKKEFVDKADGQKSKTIDMTADWQKLCTPDMIINAYEDHDLVWKDVYKKSGIDIMEITQGGTLTVTTGKKFIPAAKPLKKAEPQPDK